MGWNNCRCKVCNKTFGYFSDQSPMLREDIWKKVVKYYNLETYELEAEERFDKREDSRMVDDEHLFICYTCMEKALGRKLIPEDLIRQGVPFNDKFEKMYFTK